jgi:hypothetical protein
MNKLIHGDFTKTELYNSLVKHKKRRDTMQGMMTMACIDESARETHNEHV